MKVVIDIPEDRYADIQRIASVQLERRWPTPEQIIAKGVTINEPQKWIPVSKALPKKKDELLVTVIDEYSAFTDTDQWTGAKFWGYGDKVVAWQPFPEPWEEEQNESRS